MSILSVHNLSKSFNAYKAVNDLNFKVKQGEVFGLLGLNGAGKSTTIRCLLSLIKSDSGTIQWIGKELQSNRSAILSQIGCIVERPDHYLHLSAKQNLLFSAGMYGVQLSRTAVYGLLELVGLNGRGDAKVKTYSQGMKQRLALACAMAHNPSFILLDEPTNGLDPQGMIDLRVLIQRLKAEKNISFLVSSHLLHEMELIADSMMIMHKGTAILSGQVHELLTDDQLMVTIETDDAFALMNAMSDTKWYESMRCDGAQQLLLKAARKEMPYLHSKLMENRMPIYQVQSKRKLEDLFLSLTHE